MGFAAFVVVAIVFVVIVIVFNVKVLSFENRRFHDSNMNNPKTDNLMVSLMLALSAGLCLVWLLGWIDHDSWWPIRTAVLAVALLLIAGMALMLRQSRRRDAIEAERHFEALLKLDARGMYTEPSREAIPPLRPSNPWYALAERVRTTMVRLQQRVQEVEQARASLEVRHRRTAAEIEQIRQILTGLNDPILAIDDYDEIVLANPSAESLFSIPAEKAETRALASLVRCQKLVQLLTSTRQRKTAAQRTDEIEITDAEGQPHWYRATAVKLAAESGADESETAPGGVVAVLRDIGDQKTLQKRNAEFVSSVSHEMKTPLAGIKAYVELLADGDAEDEETREEFLSVISSQADRLQRLVNNLLNLARIEAGVVSVSKQQRSLNELLEEALNVVRPSAEAKNIELVSELSPLYLGVLADRDMLLQAAINLLSNAIKYTQSDGKVTIRSRIVDDQVRFEVQDTGVGLSEEDAQRVFEKFYRVRKDKNMASGTGLGLPLAKHIVEDVHGGRLTLESVLGQGSTFIVTLPCAGQRLGDAS